MDKPNRAERRKNKFGAGRPDAQGRWPTTAPNPVFSEAGAPHDSIAGDEDESQRAATGAGTGGATEEPDRTPHHEGAHPSHSSKG